VTIERSPHFSRRTAWPSESNRWSELRRLCEIEGRPLVDLTLSNPTRVGLPPVDDLSRGALADPRGWIYEPVARGSAEARAAIAAEVSGELSGPVSGPVSGRVSGDDFVLCASTSEAYGWLFKLLCERGDQVLVPRPSYPLLEFLAELEEVELVSYPLVYEGGWSVDLDALSSLVGPRTRAIIAIHPNNPTGHLVGPGDAAGLQELATTHGLSVISDEVFLDYLWRADSPAERPRGSLAEGSPPALTFALDGLSKSAGLPQLKLGWIRVSGPQPSKREALRRLDFIADTYLSVNAPVQVALPRILAHRHVTAEALRERCRSNLALLDRAVSRDALITRLVGDGGWSAVLRVPATRSDETWALELMDLAGVVVHPGEFYGFDQGAHLVLSLIGESNQFEEGIARLVGHVLARS